MAEKDLTKKEGEKKCHQDKRELDLT